MGILSDFVYGITETYALHYNSNQSVNDDNLITRIIDRTFQKRQYKNYDDQLHEENY